MVKQKTTVRVAGREYTLVSDQAPENIADELMKSHDENSRLRRELMTLRQALADKQQADTQRSHQDA